MHNQTIPELHNQDNLETRKRVGSRIVSIVFFFCLALFALFSYFSQQQSQSKAPTPVVTASTSPELEYQANLSLISDKAKEKAENSVQWDKEEAAKKVAIQNQSRLSNRNKQLDEEVRLLTLKLKGQTSSPQPSSQPN
jgi:cell shape-determining protein MreC